MINNVCLFWDRDKFIINNIFFLGLINNLVLVHELSVLTLNHSRAHSFFFKFFFGSGTVFPYTVHSQSTVNLLSHTSKVGPQEKAMHCRRFGLALIKLSAACYRLEARAPYVGLLLSPLDKLRHPEADCKSVCCGL